MGQFDNGTSKTYSDVVGDTKLLVEPAGLYSNWIKQKDGREYLRCGSLLAYSGDYYEYAYQPDAKYTPDARLRMVNNTLTSVQAYANNLYSCKLIYAGSNYYLHGDGAAQLAYRADLSGSFNYTSGATDPSQIYDFCQFGTSSTVIYVGNRASTNGIGYASGATTTGVASAATMYACASNTAGTLAVAVANASGANNIYTTTNGTSWTARTPTGGASQTIFVAGWMPFASKFIYLAGGSKAYTTANGYTLTDVSASLPAGWTCPATTGQETGAGYAPYSMTFAASATSAIFLDGASKLVRTTDGVNFTSISNPDFTLGGRLLSYCNGRYYASTANGFDVAYSDDDGVTWKRTKIIVDGSAYMPYYFATLNGANCFVANKAGNYPHVGTFSTDPTRLTHIGNPTAVQVAGASNIGVYERIK